MKTDLTYEVALAASLIAAVIQPSVTLGAEATPAAAAEATPAAADAESPDSSLESVIVTGTRETNVKARDSAAPIDVLPAAALQATGATDLRDALERVLPSLNHAAFAGDYGADKIGRWDGDTLVVDSVGFKARRSGSTKTRTHRVMPCMPRSAGRARTRAASIWI
jgi:hypothetical protein